MNPTFVAIDIGASSGRLMKSTRDAKGSLILEEVHRFKTAFEQRRSRSLEDRLSYQRDFD